MVLEEVFQSLTKHWQLLTGVVIVLVALYFPRGLAGLLPSLSAGNGELPPTGSSASSAASPNATSAGATQVGMQDRA